MKTNIRKDIKSFTIGTDAELILSNNGKLAPMEGEISEDFGYDGLTGAGLVNEVRVCPSECPIEITNFIYSVFKRRVARHPKSLKYDWLAGSFKLNRGIGGHLQVGYDKSVTPKELNKIVGNYMGALSLILENKTEAIKRREIGYGGLLDWRPQKWGMECRCFSSFLTSPSVTLAHLALFKVIVYEILNNKSFSPTEWFCSDDFTYFNINKVRNNFNAIWSEITQMALFKEYKEYIDVFPFLIENGLTWDNREPDIKVAWGIADTTIHKPVPKRPAMSKLCSVNYDIFKDIKLTDNNYYNNLEVDF